MQPALCCFDIIIIVHLISVVMFHMYKGTDRNVCILLDYGTDSLLPFQLH